MQFKETPRTEQQGNKNPLTTWSKILIPVKSMEALLIYHLCQQGKDFTSHRNVQDTKHNQSWIHKHWTGVSSSVVFWSLSF